MCIYIYICEIGSLGNTSACGRNNNKRKQKKKTNHNHSNNSNSNDSANDM